MTTAFDIEESWNEILKSELEKPYLFELKQRLEEEEKSGSIIYPPKEERFNAFRLTPFHSVKVVIVGQDPYHGPQQAQGLCFSVAKGIRPPPSLMNIFKELGSDIGPFTTSHGSLVSWSEQGVLLLNAILSVRSGEPASHKGIGWERFTDHVLMELNSSKKNLVFLLWGKYAQEKGAFLDSNRHLILKAAHPSPYSASGFLGCKHFSKTNNYLEKNKLSPINWVNLI